MGCGSSAHAVAAAEPSSTNPKFIDITGPGKSELETAKDSKEQQVVLTTAKLHDSDIAVGMKGDGW